MALQQQAEGGFLLQIPKLVTKTFLLSTNKTNQQWTDPTNRCCVCMCVRLQAACWWYLTGETGVPGVSLADLLVYLGLRDVSATVQPDVDDPPAEVLVPGHHVHSVAQLCHTQDTDSVKAAYFTTSSYVLCVKIFFKKSCQINVITKNDIIKM